MRQTDLLHEGHCLLMLMALQPTQQVHPKAHDPPMDKGAFKSLFQFVEEVMLTALFHPIVACWKA